MSTATDQATKERAERQALDHMADRLATQFPHVPAEDIVTTIQHHYRGFEESRIRDFVPVLVERAVKADLMRK